MRSLDMAWSELLLRLGSFGGGENVHLRSPVLFAYEIGSEGESVENHMLQPPFRLVGLE